MTPAPAATQEKIKQAREEVSKAIGGISIEKVSDKTDWINGLIYGDPGAGKTYFCGTAAEVEAMSPVLFIDVEGGTKTIRSLYPEIDVLRIKESDGWLGFSKVYEELKAKGVMGYKTIIVDSATEAYKLAMYHVMDMTIKGDPDRDPDIPARRDWGKAGELFRKMIRSFRDLDCHVFFTAHAAEVKDAKDGSVAILPSLPGKLAREIPGYLDEVFYIYTKTEKEGVVRKLLTQPTEKYIAKDRSGKLPLSLAEPTMSAVADLVLE